LLKSLRKGLCCCAKKGDGKTEFCGQPLLGHGCNQHKSLNKKEKQRRSWFFWTVAYWESEMWAGSFESHSDVAAWAGDLQSGSPEVNQRMIDDIWGKADQYMSLDASAMADEAEPQSSPLCISSPNNSGFVQARRFKCACATRFDRTHTSNLPSA